MLKTAGVLALGVAAIIAAGCGNSDSKSATDAKADQAISRAIALRASDLPGWKATESGVVPNECAVFNPAGATGFTNARPLERSLFTIGNKTAVFSNSKSAIAALPGTDDSKDRKCLADQLSRNLAKALGSDSKAGKVTVESLAPNRRASEDWAIHITAPYTNSTGVVRPNLTYGLHRQGRIINYYLFGSQDGQFANDAANQALKAVGLRTQTELKKEQDEL